MKKELLALLAKIGELSDEQLGDLESQLLSEFDELKAAGATADSIAVMTEIAEAADKVRAEASVRAEEADKAAEVVAELEARVKGPLAQEGGDGEGDAEGGEGEPAEGDADKADAEGEPAKEEDGEPASTDAKAEPAKEPVAASARRASLGRVAAKRPASQAPQMKAERAHNRIVATPDGKEFASLDEVSKEMLVRRQSFGQVRQGFAENVSVARVIADFPEERRLTAGDAPENKRRITAALQKRDEEDALVASGGLCAPVMPYYGLEQISDNARPVRAALTPFEAQRGGIRFMTPPVLTDFAGAIAQWTVENDETPSDPATKPCITVQCGDEEVVNIYAVTQCLEFGNFGARAWPEQVTNANELTLAAQARFAEGLLLDTIKTGSTAVTAGVALGAARDLLYQLGAATTAYKSRHRMARGTKLRALLPEWVLDMIREDLARSLPAYADQLAVADSVINTYLAARGINVSTYIDSPSTGTSQVFSAQVAGNLLDFPSQVQWALFHEGAWVHLDGGVLDLGLVRDSTLNSTNDFKTFAETFEAAAKLGIESIWGTSDLCPSGASSGTVDPGDFCSGAYVPQGA